MSCASSQAWNATANFTSPKRRARTSRKRGRAKVPNHRTLPVLPELRAVLDASPTGSTIFLIPEFNKPLTANGFGNRFRKWCDEAGLPRCLAHGLRKAGATIAAENGATEHQLMAIYGWESPKQAALYTRKVNRHRLAAQAMHLFVPNVPPSRGATGTGTLPSKKPN